MAHSKQEKAFRRHIWLHYKLHGRSELPWRQTTDPYRILVSEVMLQQTQVARVLPKYRAFLRRFPTVRALARADIRDVLAAWSGLGYNRRARALREAARIVCTRHAGKLPQNFANLTQLPGVGPYTARAVLTFAYNEPHVLIETNIRAVYVYHFFPATHTVHDQELLPLIERTQSATRPREWYWALMDYGAALKHRGQGSPKRSHHYKKQTPFKGSSRELRGALVRELTTLRSASVRTLAAKTKRTPVVVEEQLHRLEKDGMVGKTGRLWELTV